MKYNRTFDGVPLGPELLELIGDSEVAVPVVHAKGKNTHPAGLGVIFGHHDDEGWDSTLVMEIAPGGAKPGVVEQPPMASGAWNLTCGDCGTRLSKREAEIAEKAVRAVLARRAGAPRVKQTVELA